LFHCNKYRIKNFKNKYNVEVILEPGEAVGWQTGYLVASVLDIVDNGMFLSTFKTEYSISSGFINCPFLIFTIFSVLAASTSKSV
jgi:diaminopimelate decarboxylase